jgi:hypothetical protein
MWPAAEHRGIDPLIVRAIKNFTQKGHGIKFKEKIELIPYVRKFEEEDDEQQ